MLKAKGIKIGYTGFSLLDLGFSGRIRKKYGLFSDSYFHGISMILRKDLSLRKPGNRFYRKIYNDNVIFNYYHSFSGDTYYHEMGGLSWQNGENRDLSRDLSGPGLEYINRWYLSLQRYIRPAAIAGWGGYQAPLTISGDRSWSVPNIDRNTVSGAEERQAMESWGGDGIEETRVVSPSGRNLRQDLSFAQDETSRRFSRSLRRVSMGRLNNEQQTTSAILNIMRNLHTQFMNYQTGKQFTDYDNALYDIALSESAERMTEDRGQRQPGYLKGNRSEERLMGYTSRLDWYQGHHLHRINQTGKQITNYDIALAKHAQIMAEDRAHRQPGYHMGNSSGERLMGYTSWLDWYQGHHLHRIKRLQEEMTFERQVLENHRQRLTTRLKHLNREINELIQNKVEHGERLTEWIGIQPRRFSYRQDWLREKRWLKLELERISELPVSQRKPTDGDTESPGAQLPASANREGPGADRRQEIESVETRQKMDSIELEDTNRAGNSPGQPAAGHVDIIPETVGELIDRRANDLLVNGTEADVVYLKKLNYNDLLNEKRVQETEILRKQQQLLRVIDLMEQMNMPGMRSASKSNIPTDINRFKTTPSTEDGLSEANDQYFKSAALIIKRLDTYRQNLVMAENLNILQDLISHPLEYQIVSRRREFYKSATRTVEDKETTTQTGLYDFQKLTTGDLDINGASSNNIPELLIRNRKTILPGWYIAEVTERLRVIQNFQANHALRQHELRNQNEFWILLKAGRGRPIGRGPEYSEFIEGQRSFYYYNRPGGAIEEKQRKASRYPKQDQTLDYIYNLKRWMLKSTDIFAETWNRVWYNTALTELLNDSGLNSGDRTASASREGRQFTARQIMQSNQDTSSTGNISVYKEEAATIPGMITKNHRFFINIPGRMEPGSRLTELSILHRNVTGIGMLANEPQDFSKYSQMEYHRQGKEPEAEPDTIPTQHEEVLNSQVFNYAGEIKIDQANMERIVNNVYNEIERRLEFERERRGL